MTPDVEAQCADDGCLRDSTIRIFGPGARLSPAESDGAMTNLTGLCDQHHRIARSAPVFAYCDFRKHASRHPRTNRRAGQTAGTRRQSALQQLLWLRPAQTARLNRTATRSPARKRRNRAEHTLHRRTVGFSRQRWNPEDPQPGRRQLRRRGGRSQPRGHRAGDQGRPPRLRLRRLVIGSRQRTRRPAAEVRRRAA